MRTVVAHEIGARRDAQEGHRHPGRAQLLHGIPHGVKVEGLTREVIGASKVAARSHSDMESLANLAESCAPPNIGHGPSSSRTFCVRTRRGSIAIARSMNVRALPIAGPGGAPRVRASSPRTCSTSALSVH